MSKKRKNIIGWYIIGSAIIWGATILGGALILKENFKQVSVIFSSAAAIHLIIIWVPLAAQLKKQREEANK
ncbi:MAG: hypothetical protein C0592_01860 [Marinilabiliales bacterium]|nr:MAG: hypothetical protein C0592_01860 [Marinilabiliales bacterium]